MPVPLRNNAEPMPKINHATLQTTFVGLEHSLSSPETPIHQYRGIKYASVPGRFRHSRLWSKYPMITDASKHGPICPQARKGRSVEEAMLGLPVDACPKENLPQDEFECLNLTITCPAGLTPQSRLPVMLWIHGGGDRGHGSHWIYDGGALVHKSIMINKPMIMVAINFRIGLFGFAASSILRDDKAIGDEGVGNYGLWDQRTAMEWLHQYIDGFGGDPDNITLFGSSTGGADIICHLLSSENDIRPLFQRAAVQSAILDPVIPDVSAAGWRLSRIMAALHVTTAKDLMTLDADKLVNAGLTYRVVDDGSFFRQGWQDYFGEKSDSKPKSQLLRAVRSRSRRVSRSSSRGVRSASRSVSSPQAVTPQKELQPLIIGDCACDSHLWSVAASLWSSTSVFRRLRAVCQTLVKSNSLLRAYDINSYTPDDEIADRVLDLINDARVAWPTEHVAHTMKRERGVYRYVFDQETPSRGVPHHAADLVYLFDNVPLDIADNEPTSITVIADDSPKITTTPTPTAAPTPYVPSKSPILPATTTARGRLTRPRTLKECPSESDFDEDMELLFDDSDSDESISTPRTEDDFDWMRPIVDEWSYSRVRDAIQERWITFANGDVPWKEDKVFVFGPEGETGERSMSIFEGRRRSQLWKEALEPLGASLVHKIGVELSRGP